MTTTDPIWVNTPPRSSIAMAGTMTDTADPVTFTDVSLAAGVKIFRPTYGSPIWGDFNNDGKADVLVINHGNPSSMFRNNGNGTFTDIRQTSGITSSGDRHGAAWGDYNNDGYLDLFITIGADRGSDIGNKQDQLYKNNGNETFTDVTISTGTDNRFGRGRSVNWVDFNNDGNLDLFVKNHQSQNVLFLNNGNGTFTDVATSAGIADAPGDVSSWADYNNDGYMDLFITSGAVDQLWRNNGDGTFTEVTTPAGLKKAWYGQGIALGDYNNDGFIDFYIARGYHDTEDVLVWNSSHISFSDLESIEEDGLDFSTTGNEVIFDLFLAQCHQPDKVYIGTQEISPSNIPFVLSESAALGRPTYVVGQDRGFFIWKDDESWHVRWTSGGEATYFYGIITSNGDFTKVTPLNYTRKTPSVSSTLYKNNGNGTFTDVTSLSGTRSKQNNRGAIWGDYDNDGDLDLYVVNSGNIEDNKSNILYKNNGDETFSISTGEAKLWASGNGIGRGDGASFEDFNDDGFLDLYITNGWGRPVSKLSTNPDCLAFGQHMLYVNNRNNNKWLKVKLLGTRSNSNGIGAKVKILDEDIKILREMNGGGQGQLYSQGIGYLHFGLRQKDHIDLITIEWPSGIKQNVMGTATNQSIIVIERE